MVVDLLLSSRGDAVISWVESVRDDELVLAPAEDRTRQRLEVDVGERMEIVWRGTDDLRAMPAELVAVERGVDPVWRLRPLGPTTRGQRRAWVRAPMALPVRMTPPSGEITGTTVDVSEGGLRVVMSPAQPAADEVPVAGAPARPGPSHPTDEDEGDGDPLTPGAVVPLSLTLDDFEIPCSVEVLRRIRQEDGRSEVTLRFIGMHERTQDLIRRHVFFRLRTLRARGVL
jgi:hypothetical protein